MAGGFASNALAAANRTLTHTLFFPSLSPLPQLSTLTVRPPRCFRNSALRHGPSGLRTRLVLRAARDAQPGSELCAVGAVPLDGEEDGVGVGIDAADLGGDACGAVSQAACFAEADALGGCQWCYEEESCSNGWESHCFSFF